MGMQHAEYVHGERDPAAKAIFAAAWKHKISTIMQWGNAQQVMAIAKGEEATISHERRQRAARDIYARAKAENSDIFQHDTCTIILRCDILVGAPPGRAYRGGYLEVGEPAGGIEYKARAPPSEVPAVSPNARSPVPAELYF
jgi:hypothetical protein